MLDLQSSKHDQQELPAHAATAASRSVAGHSSNSGAPSSLVLALDPGTTQTGWCVYCACGTSECGIQDSGVMPNPEMLAMLQTRRRAGMQLAIEMIASYGMAVGREVFETCVWIGRFQQAWFDPSAVRLIYRKDVKLHLCNSPRAKDTNVWQALVDKFGPPGTKAAPGALYGVKSHARAALAVAVTALETKQEAA